jgi:hypothetical protein
MRAFSLALSILFIVLRLAQAALAEAPQPPATPQAADLRLTAKLVDGADVELAWPADADDGRAWFVEFSMGDEAEFGILTILPPTTSPKLRHPSIARDTRFNYRVRPAVSAASAVVKIATTQPTGASPGLRDEGPLDEPATAPSTTAPAAAPRGGSVKDATAAADAAPTELAATLSSPTSVDLRWRDRARDEEGQLVEISAHPDRDFAVCALLPPDATSFRKANLPPQTTVYFRVRAYALAAPSNVASVQGPPAR